MPATQIHNDIKNSLISPTWRGKNHITGLQLANNGTDATNDIDITPGECVNHDNTELMFLTALMTKRIDATWVAGSGNGGLMSGTVQNNTWYHVFLIKNTTTGVVDAGFDTSVTATTLLSTSGYHVYRRIGSVRRTSGAANKPFKQIGNDFLWETPVLDYTGSPAASRALLTLTVPLGVKTKIYCVGYVYGPSVLTRLWRIYSPDLPDQATSEANYSIRVAANNDISNGDSFVTTITNTSSQVAHRGLSTTSCNLNTYGYYDFRGQE